MTVSCGGKPYDSKAGIGHKKIRTPGKRPHFLMVSRLVAVAGKAAVVVTFPVIGAAARRPAMAHAAGAGMALRIAKPAAPLALIPVLRAASAAGEAAFFVAVAVSLAVAALLVGVPATIVTIGVPVLKIAVLIL